MKNTKRNYVVLDVETTTKNKGNFSTPSNKLCIVGLYDKDGYHEYKIEYDDTPYGDSLKEIKERIESADLLIGFNIKFDLHWIRRYIPDVRFPNEVDYITKLLGGSLVHIVRKSIKEIDPSLIHESEQHYSEFKPAYILGNNKDMKQLEMNVINMCNYMGVESEL